MMLKRFSLHYRALLHYWIGPLLLLVGLAAASPARAHKSSDAYLRVTDSLSAVSTGIVQRLPEAGDSVSLSISIALKDLDAALDQLDADADRLLTWGEIRQATPAIERWVGDGLQWQCSGSMVSSSKWNWEALEQRSDGRYARLSATVDCPTHKTLNLKYSLLQGVDPTHRLLVAGELSATPIAAVLEPDSGVGTDLRSVKARNGFGAGRQGASGTADVLQSGGIATLIHFVREGIHHILEGYDHLAFLLALLLPISIFPRRSSSQGVDLAQAVVSFKPTSRWLGLNSLLVTVTCFTLGHSITLAFAGLGVVRVSSQWIEPAIAISIGVSAWLNLYPVRGLRSSWLALGFGLVHGLAFSGVLVEAGVAGSLQVWALAGFNLGVEAGQLLLVALWCLVSMTLMRWRLYTRVVVRGGSAVLLALSVYWTVQRVVFAG